MDTTIVKLLLAVAILFVLWKVMASRKGWRMGGMASGPRPYDPAVDREFYDEDEDAQEGDDEDMEEDEDMMEDGYEGFAAPMSVSAALLPKPDSRFQNFGEFAPKALKGQNFLEATKFIGVNTIGSSLRNANYDLRSAPPIPRRQVGPWSQSTIDPDPYRKPLE